MGDPETPVPERILREISHDAVPVIADRDAYLTAVDVIAKGHGPIAVDAERASGFRYSQRAYLIQVFRRGAGTFLFDPPAVGDFGELQQVIKDTEWVLHAASQDLACLREVGLDPTLIFDTELGARLLGIPRVGLGAVVADLLGIHLAKEHSAADWSTRPLPQSWLDYAALDVELLIDLRDQMHEMLVETGKLEIAAQEFAAVRDKEDKAPRVDPWRRLSGIHALRNPRALAVARELWLARDAFAQETDTAPGRLVPDNSLAAVARTMPESRRALTSMRDFTGRASRTEADRWWAAIEAGRTTEDLPPTRISSDTLPPPRAWADRNPEADARLKAARAAIISVSEDLNVPLENLLTPETLRRVAWAPPVPLGVEAVSVQLATLGARPWQIEQTAQLIVDAFVDSVQEVPEDPSLDS